MWVTATPEELVRQDLLKRMVHQLGFPKDLVVVEKDIKQLPHLQSETQPLPDRRVDIICFAKGIHLTQPLYPLLLIECKEDALDQKAVDQVVGYNHFVNACFVALANSTDFKFGYYDQELQSYRFIESLPSYQKLLALSQKS